MEFYKTAFGAEEVLRLAWPDGKIAHAELKIGPALVMLADEGPEVPFKSPKTYGGSGTMLHLHVANVDALVKQAVSAGATILRGPTDEGHGERQCLLCDPFGHLWLLGHENEKVSPEEIKRRWDAEVRGKK